LIEIGGERCSKCRSHKRHPVTGRVPLEIDHLDGNYADNSPSNVGLLCPNCHALTPTYRALNKGNGRPSKFGRLRLVPKGGLSAELR
jgi:hypothetical protein